MDRKAQLGAADAEFLLVSSHPGSIAEQRTHWHDPTR
jgi:hypothetical protein